MNTASSRGMRETQRTCGASDFVALAATRAANGEMSLRDPRLSIQDTEMRDNRDCISRDLDHGGLASRILVVTSRMGE
jgi:hypothetical protein